MIKNTLAILSATTMLTMGAAAFAADEVAKGETKVEYKDDGGYKSTQSSEHVNADGTKTSSEAKVDVDVDKDGQVEKTVKTESTTDPKGLLNAKKDTSKAEVEEKDRGGYKQTVTREHKDSDGTNVKEKSTTDVSVDREGNVTETTKNEKVVDPKGLMNKEKSVSKTKSVNGRVVEETKTTAK